MADNEWKQWITVTSAPHLQSKNSPKDWFIVNAAWHPVRGRKKVVDKGTENREQGAPFAKNMSRSRSLDRFPQWIVIHLQKSHIPSLDSWCILSKKASKWVHLIVVSSQKHFSHLWTPSSMSFNGLP